MKTNWISLLIIGISLGLGSCMSGSDSSSLLPNVTGRSGEVLLIMDDATWKGPAGEAAQEILEEEVPALPQVEPMFDVSRIQEDAFSRLLRPHRNIVRTNINKDLKKAQIVFRQNVWARPQSVVAVSAPSTEALTKILSDNKDKIQRYFKLSEMKRTSSRYKKYAELAVSRDVARTHHLNMVVPKGFSVATDTSNFVWINHETSHIYQGVFIYYTDYLDTTDFQQDHLLNMRDQFLKRYIPGPARNSYMATDRDFPITYKEFTRDDMYMVEMRGLWRVEKDFMGGPFVSHSFVDEYRNRLVTVEGWVYAPRFDKRNYLRQVETIIHSVTPTVPEHLAEEQDK